jgi:hypothetical protein
MGSGCDCPMEKKNKTHYQRPLCGDPLISIPLYTFSPVVFKITGQDGNHNPILQIKKLRCIEFKEIVEDIEVRKWYLGHLHTTSSCKCGMLVLIITK